jgi:hypothetical protein
VVPGKRSVRAPLIPIIGIAVLLAAGACFCTVAAMRAGGPADPSSPPEAPGSKEQATAAVDSLAPVPPSDRVVVYYFHHTLRCDTCLKFEAYTDEALRAAFPDELASGVLEWHAVNVDEEKNAHYEDDYDLTEISLLVSEVRDGDEVDWRILGAIWGLVQDKGAFVSYVEDEVAISLERLDEGGLPQDSDSLPVHRELVPESDGGGVDAPPQG